MTTLRGLRKQRGLTQEQVAAAAGLSDRNLLSNLENGKRTMSERYAAKLEPVLGPDVWLLVTSPEPPADTDEPEPSFGARLGSLEAILRNPNTAMTAYMFRLEQLEKSGQDRADRLDGHDAQLRAIHARLDALAEAVATLELRLSPPGTGEAQG